MNNINNMADCCITLYYLYNRKPLSDKAYPKGFNGATFLKTVKLYFKAKAGARLPEHDEVEYV